MYLTHFGLSELPFTLTPNTEFYCALEPHNEAMQVLLTALNMGEGFIKVTGEVGTGKTLLCRKLIDSFDDNTLVAYIANSYLTPEELRWALALELGIESQQALGQQALSQTIQDRLLHLSHAGKRVILVIDEAQCLSWESLEAIRLITNLETQTRKLLQVVLFGQPELDEKLAKQRVRQIRQRISFSYQLRAMNISEVVYYINHRIAVAGINDSALFTNKTAIAIAKASRGIPRLVNILCHKVLLQSYGEGKDVIEYKHVVAAVKDTEDCSHHNNHKYLSLTLAILVIVFLVSYWQLML